MGILMDPGTRILTFPLEMVMYITNHIDLNAVFWLSVGYLIYLILRSINRTRTGGKLGATTRNMLLFANLKNYVNGMDEQKRTIYEVLFHNIIMSEDDTGEIIALKSAAEDLNIYIDKNKIIERGET